MDNAELARLGQAVYGLQWHSKMANELGMKRYEFDKLVRGRKPITDCVERHVLAVALSRLAHITRALETTLAAE